MALFCYFRLLHKAPVLFLFLSGVEVYREVRVKKTQNEREKMSKGVDFWLNKSYNITNK